MESTLFEELLELYQIDWRIFMAGVAAWLRGDSPYGPLSAEFSAGAFAYPPTALTWLAIFSPLGPFGFYIWTILQLCGWWLLIRDQRRAQLLLLIWSPMTLHLVQGQSTLAMVLIMWAAFRASHRGVFWGLAIAVALTKPQVVFFPLIWLLWQDRHSTMRWHLLGGIVLGSLLLALPPTILNPGIWVDWIESLGTYRERILQMAAWQGPSILLLGLATYLWYRYQRGKWHWWLAAGVFPHTSFYGIVALLPTLNPQQNAWTLAGLALAGILQGPVTPLTLPWILAGHMLAAWMLAGGPRSIAIHLSPATTPASDGT